MNGVNLFVDTNILIDLSEGKRQVAHYIDGNRIHISIITEIELLGWYKITPSHKELFRNLIDECTVLELSESIKNISIELKQKHKIKLPDAVIAASALSLDIPLLTRDLSFEKIKSLNLLIIE
jgi:predicted nucleic acid-binding protein